MTEVFWDTSFAIALSSVTDQNHVQDLEGYHERKFETAQLRLQNPQNRKSSISRPLENKGFTFSLSVTFQVVSCKGCGCKTIWELIQI